MQRLRTAIRADASPGIGAGHVMRCLALARALGENGGHVRFVCRRMPATYRDMVRGAGHELVELEGDAPEEAARALQGVPWDWLIVDHYGLDARWERALRPRARRILAIDDLADRPHDCDALLDPNVLDPARGGYDGKVPQGCRLLLGPAYALLRPEFARLRASTAARRGPVRRILVLMGGIDADNETGKAIRALARLGQQPLEVDVAVGAEHPALEAIRAACRREGYRCHVQSAEVAALMARADLAIGGCGSTSWERCCLGLPALCVILAANQARIAADLAARGAIVLLGEAADVGEDALAQALLGLVQDPQPLAAMSAAGLALTDGRGAARVCDFMREAA